MPSERPCHLNIQFERPRSLRTENQRGSKTFSLRWNGNTSSICDPEVLRSTWLGSTRVPRSHTCSQLPFACALCWKVTWWLLSDLVQKKYRTHMLLFSVLTQTKYNISVYRVHVFTRLASNKKTQTSSHALKIYSWPTGTTQTGGSSSLYSHTLVFHTCTSPLSYAIFFSILPAFPLTEIMSFFFF